MEEVKQYVKQNFKETDVPYNKETLKAFGLGLHAAGLTFQEKEYEEANQSVFNTHKTLQEIIHNHEQESEKGNTDA